jgi:hypothetical protein
MRTLTTSSQLVDFLDWPFHKQVLSRIFWKAARFRPAPIGAAGFASEPMSAIPLEAIECVLPEIGLLIREDFQSRAGLILG